MGQIWLEQQNSTFFSKNKKSNFLKRTSSPNSFLSNVLLLEKTDFYCRTTTKKIEKS